MFLELAYLIVKYLGCAIVVFLLFIPFSMILESFRRWLDQEMNTPTYAFIIVFCAIWFILTMGFVELFWVPFKLP